MSENNQAEETEGPKRASRNYVLCPTCDARSHVLYSEMGGLETRECANGHIFEYDRWLADRAFWSPTATLHLTRPPRRSRGGTE